MVGCFVFEIGGVFLLLEDEGFGGGIDSMGCASIGGCGGHGDVLAVDDATLTLGVL